MKTKLVLLCVLASQLIFSQMDEKFYQPSKTFKPIENVSYTEFQIPVENDTISGIFLRPKTKAKATILFFHGTGGNVSTYMFMTKPLVEAGYQVLMVDFRGYGKSTGRPTHVNIASDGQKFLDYALALKEVQGTPVILYGASMGTQIAAHLAGPNSSKIAGVVLDGTISSFNEVAIHFAPQAEPFLRNMIFPYGAREDMRLVLVPKIFIHSKGDTTIPFEEGKSVYDNAPAPKKFIEYDGDHLQALVKDREEVLSEIERFILKNNPQS